MAVVNGAPVVVTGLRNGGEVCGCGCEGRTEVFAADPRQAKLVARPGTSETLRAGRDPCPALPAAKGNNASVEAVDALPNRHRPRGDVKPRRRRERWGSASGCAFQKMGGAESCSRQKSQSTSTELADVAWRRPDMVYELRMGDGSGCVGGDVVSSCCERVSISINHMHQIFIKHHNELIDSPTSSCMYMYIAKGAWIRRSLVKPPGESKAESIDQQPPQDRTTTSIQSRREARRPPLRDHPPSLTRPVFPFVSCRRDTNTRRPWTPCPSPARIHRSDPPTAATTWLPPKLPPYLSQKILNSEAAQAQGDHQGADQSRTYASTPYHHLIKRHKLTCHSPIPSRSNNSPPSRNPSPTSSSRRSSCSKRSRNGPATPPPRPRSAMSTSVWGMSST